MAVLRQGTTAENYHRWLLIAFAYRGFRPRRARAPLDPIQRLVRDGRRAFFDSLKSLARAEPVTFENEDGTPASHSSLQREVTYPNNIEEVIDAGECLEEHAVIRTSVSVPSSINKRPLLDRLYRRLLARRAAIANQRRFWWDLSTLPISSIADVLQQLISAHLEDQTSFNSLSELAYVALVCFTGQDPDKVAELELLRDWSTDESALRKDQLFFDLTSNCLAYVVDHQTLGYYQGDTPDFVTQCCPTSPWVVLPLHPIVVGILRSYLDARAKLPSVPPSLSDRGFLMASLDQIGALTAATVNAKLKALQAGVTSQAVTIQGLANSLVIHLTTQFDLDPLLACYLSGRVPFHLRAQMFYTHVSVTELRTKLSSSVCTFAEKVEQEFSSRNEQVNDFWRNSKFEGICLSEVPQAWPGTGSRCVMTDEAIRAFFETYRKQLTQLRARVRRFSSLEDKILLFNLVMVHNYIIYQFATGVRPLKDPPITAHTIRDVDTKTSRVILRDKRNIRFPESREIAHAAIAHTALQMCAEASSSIRSILSQEGIRIDEWWESHGQPYFFVLSELGQPQHLSPSAITYWLAAVEGVTPLYLVPKNAPRHYLRSSLFRAGFSLAFIDRILGHMHAGHEPTSVLAATATQEADTLFKAHVQRMTAKLGLAPISYSLG